MNITKHFPAQEAEPELEAILCGILMIKKQRPA
jgi:hypothetical protein